MRFGIIVFPGTSCDHDTYHVLSEVFGQEAEFIWHKETAFEHLDCIVIPGGSSYGDYLRAGAVARFSPIMGAVERYAESGGLVFGICNGFQILTEAGLLPGALMPNECLEFRCQWVNLRVEHANSPLTGACKPGQLLRLPIKHYEGRYYLPEEQLDALEAAGQVLLRYTDAEGRLTAESNPNGSARSIAGISNKSGNVFGLMPQPEQGSELILGSTDGALLFRSVIEFQQTRIATAGAQS